MSSRRGLASVATVVTATLWAWACPAFAEPQEGGLAPPPGETRLRTAQRTASGILLQPVRDAGFLNAEIPDALARASLDPYALAEATSCSEVTSEIGELNAFLGSDVARDAGPREDRAERLAVAGGRAAVNSLIPFRTVVRELTGAAPAQRRLQSAIDLGYARRGFLRAVYRLHGCDGSTEAH